MLNLDLDSLLKVPFIVAGATAHGSQLAAALAMGASGVEIGTGFMATEECNIKQGIKDCITSPTTDESSTILLLRKVHNVGRFYKNPLTTKVFIYKLALLNLSHSY